MSPKLAKLETHAAALWHGVSAVSSQQEGRSHHQAGYTKQQ